MPAPSSDSSSALVSIIVRSMDRPSLPEALDSIAAQTWPRLEIVVVNAKGPSHQPLPLLWGGRPLRMISTGEPLPRSRAANVGLVEAKGHYLGFLDDDDLFLPEHIAGLIHELEGHPTLKTAYAGVRVDAYEHGTDKLIRSFPFNDPYSRPKLLGRNFIPIHAVIFSAELIRQGGSRFDESLDILEDWDFWIQLAMQTDFCHRNVVSAVYRNRGSSGLAGDVNASDAALKRATGRVFEKWKTVWSGDDLAEIVLFRDAMCESAGLYVEGLETEYEAKLQHEIKLSEARSQKILQLNQGLTGVGEKLKASSAESPKSWLRWFGRFLSKAKKTS